MSHQFSTSSSTKWTVPHPAPERSSIDHCEVPRSSYSLEWQLISNIYIHGSAEHKLGVSGWLELLHCCTEVSFWVHSPLFALSQGCCRLAKMMDARKLQQHKTLCKCEKYYYFHFQTNEDLAFIHFQHVPQQALGHSQECSLLKVHNP